jgi:2-keto-3-deoxy-L-rhamnonate aldolase RhmA
MNATTPCLGTWLSTGSPVVAELIAVCGFDWVLIDLEHGCEAEAAVPGLLRALRGSRTQGIVRVGAAYPDLIARVLDWGAQGIMVPHVESAEQARAIVAATRYSPHGRRGLSRTVRAYDYGLRKPGDPSLVPPLVMAQIETIEGVRAVRDIASVDGIDVLFIGPADLRFDLEQRAADAPGDYAFCVQSVLSAAKGAGKSAGILVRDVSQLAAHVEQGFQYVAAESDLAILRNAYQGILSLKYPKPKPVG